MSNSSQASPDVTTTISDDLFFAEELLIAAVRDAVPELLSVGGYTDLPTTIESAGATPAAFVVYEGAAKGTRDVPGAAISAQLWTVAVLVRKIDPKGSANRAIAGPLLAKVARALLGLRLPGCLPLVLVAGPTPLYYPGGQAVFYLTFQLSSLLPPK
ncbi:hypothetical protein SAMN05446935_0330 [Burkholderia sp. YR290]|nr:hypothetical protein SAMN05446935_0330 [Burkholderia sp. YR290]